MLQDDDVNQGEVVEFGNLPPDFFLGETTKDHSWKHGPIDFNLQGSLIQPKTKPQNTDLITPPNELKQKIIRIGQQGRKQTTTTILDYSQELSKSNATISNPHTSQVAVYQVHALAN